MTVVKIECAIPEDAFYILREWYDVRGVISVYTIETGLYGAIFNCQAKGDKVRLTDNDLITPPKSAWLPSHEIPQKVQALRSRWIVAHA